MKAISCVLISITTLALIISVNSQGKDPKGFDRTPKALDLEDHFGTEPVLNIFGPQSRGVVVDIAREFDSVDGSRVFTPITNFAQEINPLDVVHGNLDNTAYDASRIIRPEIADPKAEIKAKYISEAIINTPVHLGTKFETKLVRTQNRVTGEENEKVVNTEKPIIGVLKNLRQVDQERTTFVNIRNGNIINTQKPTMLHGTD